MPDDTPHAPWTVVFADGSGNSTTVERDAADGPVTLRYRPVTPAESSSGVYSGGQPRSKPMEARRAAELWRAVRGAEQAKGQHTATRTMGSARVILTVDGKNRSFGLAPGEAMRRLQEVVDRMRRAVPAR